MIKVLHLTRNLGIGGLEKVIFDLCREIDRSRFDVSVCCLHFKGEFGESLEKMGVQVGVLPASRQVDYFGFFKVARILKEVKPDILHTHNSHAFIDGSLAAAVVGRGIVVNTDHGRKYPDRKRILLAERVCAKSARGIVAVSEHTKDQMAEHGRIPIEKIRVIHNGIDQSKYVIEVDKARKRSILGIGNSFPLLGLGARLTRDKGIEYLLDAMQSLVLRFPCILFVLAGKGELEQELRERSEKLGVAEHVRFLGARMDWNEILQLLDIYVLPSVSEGLPLGLLEAMAAGKPIVATSVGGVPSVIGPNENGLLVSPRNPAQLADAIQALALDRDLAENLAGNALKRYSESFTLARMVSSYEELYSELASGKDLRDAAKH